PSHHNVTLFPYTTLFRSQRVRSGCRKPQGSRENSGGRSAQTERNCDGPVGLLHLGLLLGASPVRDRFPVRVGLRGELAASAMKIDRKSTRLNSSHQIISY